MSNTLPPPPLPTVYAHVMPFPKPTGRVTGDNWYEALLELQDTREAHMAMRDVWQWEQAHRLGLPEPSVKPAPKAVPAPRAATAVCFVCGKEFYRTNGRQIYCSRACRKRHGYASRPKSSEFPRDAFCEGCGMVFSQRRGNHLYCTEACSDRRLHRKKQAARGEA